ncbi:hypothetical protein F66182_404 [Fusarium sp. NRRL 66182]|nr:hypothetical protein F66182_404 [Fusarium sp. NRRL 66182]
MAAMADFDPYLQNVTFLAADGQTPINIPIPAIDNVRSVIVNNCINYGVQLGACLIMLVILLVMIPRAKFRKPSNVLQIISLVICSIRMLLLSLYYPSKFTDFYPFWSHDFSSLGSSAYASSIAANTMSLCLVVSIEMTLMNQAWTMVRLWPGMYKYLIVGISLSISLLTIASRLAFTVIQNQANLKRVPAWHMFWLIQWTVIMNVLSISWWCAIFNIKLVWHVIANRGILPSYTTLTPMEVLIMTNGILMIIPVTFAALEWAHFIGFEAASLTLTSVAIILPLGTLAAQRIAGTSTNNSAASGASSGAHYGTSGPNSLVAFKAPSFSTHRSGATDRPHVSVFARCEAGMSSRDHINPTDVELVRMDADDNHHVRVDRSLLQREERI